jgi:hypothetical protein
MGQAHVGPQPLQELWQDGQSVWEAIVQIGSPHDMHVAGSV